MGLVPSADEKARQVAVRMLAEGLDEAPLEIMPDGRPGGMLVVREVAGDRVFAFDGFELDGVAFYVGLRKPKEMQGEGEGKKG